MECSEPPPESLQDGWGDKGDSEEGLKRTVRGSPGGRGQEVPAGCGEGMKNLRASGHRTWPKTRTALSGSPLCVPAVKPGSQERPATQLSRPEMGAPPPEEPRLVPGAPRVCWRGTDAGRYDKDDNRHHF